MKIDFRRTTGLLLACAVNLPVFWASHLVPKNKNLWLFGSQKGDAFSENSKHFYRYVYENHKEYTVFWITKSKQVFSNMKRMHLPVVYAYSVRGYFVSARSGVVFTSHFSRVRADYNDYATTKATKNIQLWHGSPLKRIGVQRPDYPSNYIGIILTRCLRWIFPFLKSRTSCHKFLAASTVVGDTVKGAYNLNDEHVWVSGYPKNDTWLKKNYTKATEPIGYRKVLYIPTWRTCNNRLFSNYEFDAKRLDRYCETHNVNFQIKLHPFYPDCDEIRDICNKFDNLELLECDDIYDCLHEYDILVTDYSSILFDYLLIDRPVVFADFDLDEYENEDVGFFFNYHYVSINDAPKVFD